MHDRCRLAQAATSRRSTDITAFQLGDRLGQAIVLFLHLLQLLLYLLHLEVLLDRQSLLFLVLNFDLQVLLEGTLKLLLDLVLLLF